MGSLMTTHSASALVRGCRGHGASDQHLVQSPHCARERAGTSGSSEPCPAHTGDWRPVVLLSSGLSMPLSPLPPRAVQSAFPALPGTRSPSPRPPTSLLPSPSPCMGFVGLRGFFSVWEHSENSGRSGLLPSVSVASPRASTEECSYGERHPRVSREEAELASSLCAAPVGASL